MSEHRCVKCAVPSFHSSPGSYMEKTRWHHGFTCLDSLQMEHIWPWDRCLFSRTKASKTVSQAASDFISAFDKTTNKTWTDHNYANYNKCSFEGVKGQNKTCMFHFTMLTVDRRYSEHQANNAKVVKSTIITCTISDWVICLHKWASLALLL